MKVVIALTVRADHRWPLTRRFACPWSVGRLPHCRPETHLAVILDPTERCRDQASALPWSRAFGLSEFGFVAQGIAGPDRWWGSDVESYGCRRVRPRPRGSGMRTDDREEQQQMTDTRATRAQSIPEPGPDFRTPDQEMAEEGRDVPDAAELSISQINPLNAAPVRRRSVARTTSRDSARKTRSTSTRSPAPVGTGRSRSTTTSRWSRPTGRPTRGASGITLGLPSRASSRPEEMPHHDVHRDGPARAPRTASHGHAVGAAAATSRTSSR